jgi:hypothetical protein
VGSGRPAVEAGNQELVARSDDDGLTWRTLQSFASSFPSSTDPLDGYPSQRFAISSTQNDALYTYVRRAACTQRRRRYDVATARQHYPRYLAGAKGRWYIAVDSFLGAGPAHLLRSDDDGANWTPMWDTGESARLPVA